MNYTEFLKQKEKYISDSGFEAKNLNKNLFDFQAYIVARNLRKGKDAIWADCGLGKSIMQLEYASQVVRHTNKPVLILTPLAVSGQTLREAEKFGIEAKRFSGKYSPCVYVTNYQQLDNIDCSYFDGVVLDESSILKNFTGKTKQQIIETFARTKYKLACTATPSPNDNMELCNHAEFLNVCTRLEMLSKYFVHDGGETSVWRLKGHAERDFYHFMSQWAIMLTSPADIGFDGSKHVLPPLNIIEHHIETSKQENGRLFNDLSVNSTNHNQQLRVSLKERIAKVEEIHSMREGQKLVWVKMNEESKIISKELNAVEVTGSMSDEEKEEKLLGFANGEFETLVTKAKIAQFGMNFQNCHNQIDASPDFSFESLYQRIRRSYRFGQKSAVNIDLITTDTMQNVIQSIKRKESEFENLKKKMIAYAA